MITRIRSRCIRGNCTSQLSPGVKSLPLVRVATQSPLLGVFPHTAVRTAPLGWREMGFPTSSYPSHPGESLAEPQGAEPFPSTGSLTVGTAQLSTPGAHCCDSPLFSESPCMEAQYRMEVKKSQVPKQTTGPACFE